MSLKAERRSQSDHNSATPAAAQMRRFPSFANSFEIATPNLSGIEGAGAGMAADPRRFTHLH
jgi:hypothetical protein